jgi:hypothetical protein
MTEQLKQISSQKSNFVCKHTGDELLLIPLKNNVADFNQYLVLNELGAFIWEQIDESSTFEILREAIYKEFDAPQQRSKKFKPPHPYG